MSLFFLDNIFYINPMRFFIHVFCCLIEISIAWLFIEKIINSSSEAMEQWNRSYQYNLCGRFDAMVENLKYSIIWMRKHAYSEEKVNLAQTLFFDLQNQWELELRRQNLDCHRYRSQYHLHMQKNPKLDQLYPNWVYKRNSSD